MLDQLATRNADDLAGNVIAQIRREEQGDFGDIDRLPCTSERDGSKQAAGMLGKRILITSFSYAALRVLMKKQDSLLVEVGEDLIWTR